MTSSSYIFQACKISKKLNVGPNNLWPWPTYSLGLKAQAEKGYSSGSVIQVPNSPVTQPRTIRSLAGPRPHRKEGQKDDLDTAWENI